ncbi:hypothetical protein R3P38DRAFT_2530349 [Favolaschia claudopus]|uniref:Uncharacterized protein n=1 Tax=Favolaschia claudopus TaxID=2862362 RepID=A0AAW0BDJ9_9AGAR
MHRLSRSAVSRGIARNSRISTPHPRRSIYRLTAARISTCSERRSGRQAFAVTVKRPNSLLQAWQRGANIRQYSDEAQTRIEEEGIPLVNSGPTTASLLAYAEANWPSPSVIPPGWSSNWQNWDYLLTLFAFSPYFLRLPQIEMLVNVKFGIPGEVKPIMYSDARQSVLFSTEVPTDPEMPGSDSRADGAGYVFLLNCKTFEIWTYDPERGENAPDTIEELVLLVGAAPTPEGVPMKKLEPEPEGEAALKRILDRDPTVISLLEDEFLGYAPRATERDEELVDANKAAAKHKEKFAEAIRDLREYVRETEVELAKDEMELRELRETGSTEWEDEEKGFRLDEEAHMQMRAALEDTKEKLEDWERLWTESYGPWVDVDSK